MLINEIIVKPKDPRFKDLEGCKINNWEVLYYAGKWGKKQKTRFWYCKCVCGKYKLVAASSLNQGISKSCGCKRVELEDFTGKKKDYLTVLKRIENTSRGKVQWLCSCICGNQVKRTSDTLKGDFFSSCGCYVKENLSKKNVHDLTGMKFGRLKVLSLSDYNKAARWLCKCDCGKNKVVASKNLKDGSTKSCGCLDVDLKKSRKGEKHPNYNPLLTEKDRISRRLKDISLTREWRKSVYERDNFTCQCCFKRNGDLNAHHLDGYHWCVEGRFNLENGVTLCEECHKSFHKQYGYKNNTKEQFEEYLSSIKSTC